MYKDKEVKKNVKNIFLSMCDVKVFLTFTFTEYGTVFISNSTLPSRHLRGMKSIFSIQSGVIYVNIVSHKISEHLIP
jgi:hypothetical protein